MSAEALRWADTQSLPEQLGAMLAFLAGFHDGRTKRCYPSIRTLARRAHCAEATVKRRILTLQAIGLVTKKSTYIEARRATAYTLILTKRIDAPTTAKQFREWLRERKQSASNRDAALAAAATKREKVEVMMLWSTLPKGGR